MAKRRRQASSRASGLATNSSNGIGRLRVHNPPGERKSGMPHSVEMPAPVKGMMDDASAIMLPSCSTPLRRSGAITGDIRLFSKRFQAKWRPVRIKKRVKTRTRADYSTADRNGRSADPARPGVSRASSSRFGNRLLRFPHLFGLLDLGDGHALRFLHGLAVLGEIFQFRLELGAAHGDLLEQLVGGVLAEGCEFFDAQ